MTLFSCIPRAKSSKSFFMTVRGPGKRLILPRQKIRDNNKTARIIKVPDSEIHRKMVQVRFHERKKKKKEKKKEERTELRVMKSRVGCLKKGLGLPEAVFVCFCRKYLSSNCFQVIPGNKKKEERSKKQKNWSLSNGSRKSFCGIG
jgi:hypothetical protein